jgi:serine protease Do
VEPGSPAEKAGIEAGDIITRFEGRVIERFGELPRQVGNTKPGTKSAITVFRRGATKELSILVAEIEAETPVAKAPAKEERPRGSAAGQALGLVVSEVPDAQKKEMRIKGGVKVDAATEGAAQAGLREGDVIVAIANTEIAGVKDFEAVIAKVDRSKPVNVLFRRGDWAQYALIRAQR